jgi:hypothetical protein
MRTKVQFITNLHEGINIYYVRDQFGRTWHTVGRTPQNAIENIKHREDASTFKLYSTSTFGETLPQYDFKNLVLDMLEQMGLQDTYEYEIVVVWSDYEALSFMRSSSLLPTNILIEINKFSGLGGNK